MFPTKKALLRTVFLALGAFLSGIVGGLFGTGGGILIVFLYTRFFKGQEEISRKDIFAMTVATVILMSASSLASYFGNGAVTMTGVLPVLLPAALGGFCGAVLLDKLDIKWLDRIFSLLILYAGATLLFGR